MSLVVVALEAFLGKGFEGGPCNGPALVGSFGGVFKHSGSRRCTERTVGNIPEAICAVNIYIVNYYLNL
jgi:hypothetical protein